MKRNASKYRAIVMGKLNVIPKFYCNSTIPITGDLEMVGVCIDDKIQFERHIANVCKKVSQHIAVLKLMKKILPFETRKCLYLGFIIPHFNYCSEPWHFCNKNITAKVEKIKSWRFTAQKFMELNGHFPFDQKYRKFRVGERMEQSFS